jgi:hypothetical protein
MQAQRKRNKIATQAQRKRNASAKKLQRKRTATSNQAPCKLKSSAIQTIQTTRNASAKQGKG